MFINTQGHPLPPATIMPQAAESAVIARQETRQAQPADQTRQSRAGQRDDSGGGAVATVAPGESSQSRGHGLLFSLAALMVAIAGLAVWLAPEGFGNRAAQAPDLSFRMPGRTPVSLAELRGQVVLVSFWGATCEHCSRQQPAVRELQRSLGDRGFVAIGVGSIGDALSASHDHPHDRGAMRPVLNMPMALDVDGALARALGADQRLPTHVLIDRRGRVVTRLEGDVSPARLQGRVSELMAAR